MAEPNRDERMRLLEKVHVHNVYERIARRISVRKYRTWPKIRQFLEDQEPGSLVADIGCGDGKYLKVSPNSYSVGCDRCVNMTVIARGRGHQVALGDNLSLPFRDGCFDAVLSVSVIHHFSSRKRRVEALREIARVLAVGGRALIYVWSLEQKHRKFGGQDVLVPYHILQESCPESPSKAQPAIKTIITAPDGQSGIEQSQESHQSVARKAAKKEKNCSNSSSISDDDQNLDSPKVLLHHSKSEEFEGHKEEGSISTNISEKSDEDNECNRYAVLAATAAHVIKEKLKQQTLAAQGSESQQRLGLIDSDVEGDTAGECEKKYSRVSAIKQSVLLCFNSRSLADMFRLRSADKASTSDRSSVIDLPDEMVMSFESQCREFLDAEITGRIFEVREFPRSSLVGSPSQLSLDEQYIKSKQDDNSQVDLFGNGSSVYDSYVGLHKRSHSDAMPELTISSPDLVNKSVEETVEEKMSPKYKSAEVLGSIIVHHANIQSEKCQSAEELLQTFERKAALKSGFPQKGDDSLSSLEEVETAALVKPLHKYRVQHLLTVTSNTSLTSNSSNESHDSGISADMSDSSRPDKDADHVPQRPLDVIEEADNNGAGSPESNASQPSIVSTETGTTAVPSSDNSDSSLLSSSSAYTIIPVVPVTSVDSTRENVFFEEQRDSGGSSSSDSDETVITAPLTPPLSKASFLTSPPPGDMSFYTLTAADDDDSHLGAVGGVGTRGECTPTFPCIYPDFTEIYFSDSDEDGDFDLEEGMSDFLSSFRIPEDIETFDFAAMEAQLSQTRSFKSESLSSEDSSATVIENPLGSETKEEDLDSVFVEDTKTPSSLCPHHPVKPKNFAQAAPVASIQSTVPSVPGYPPHQSTFHRYYHVFRKGELEDLIEKHVDNLHITKSYYDHANWCVIVEKVQVWSI